VCVRESEKVRGRERERERKSYLGWIKNVWFFGGPNSQNPKWLEILVI